MKYVIIAIAIYFLLGHFNIHVTAKLVAEIVGIIFILVMMGASSSSKYKHPPRGRR